MEDRGLLCRMAGDDERCRKCYHGTPHKHLATGRYMGLTEEIIHCENEGYCDAAKCNTGCRQLNSGRSRFVVTATVVIENGSKEGAEVLVISRLAPQKYIGYWGEIVSCDIVSCDQTYGKASL